MKTIVIYHANCADGFGAAYAAWTKFGDKAEYVPLRYDQRDAWFDANFERCLKQSVLVLDFSFSLAQTELFINQCGAFTWLDHHKTAFEMWCGTIPADGKWGPTRGANYMIELDNNRSGALIAWEFFNPAPIPVPALIQHVDDYDRWQFKLDGTKQLNKALWSYAPWTFEDWARKYEGNTEQLIVEGAAIQRAHEQNVRAVVAGAMRRCKVLSPDGMQVFEGRIANCPSHLTSDVGHELAVVSGTFGLCWSMTKDGKVACSMRSNGEYDVSAIAKLYGGGGHRNAAGFETDMATLLRWMR